MKQLIHRMYAGICLHAVHLLLHLVIIRYVLNITDNTKSHREIRPLHVGKHGLETEIVLRRVMHQDIVRSYAVLPYLHDFQQASRQQ